MPVSPIPDIDVERGTFRVGWKTAVAVVIALITATVGGVTAWGQMATKTELRVQVEMLRAQAVAARDQAQSAVDAADGNRAKLQTLNALSGRIEFLVEAQMEEARTDRRTRKTTDTAMRRVRARAKAQGEPDPIPDLQL